ncbi:COQ9 family protein [Ehrlichia chaffeensis str. Heartland]|nr:COQ9 family protein [Ehrlichia chaffeensis]AHX03986.1 COQ9 family protein [Ehrlichia chaffeensis str. Heartland]AHX05281.1 COQ9 family protein [Ehrlichia chaffeensis str. Jax]AHX06269.1 COQ9 family protein [Ehrlichia chaffeensis str. Liberty]AHX07261.1 COQ9 family protein [Ehrlichia chaffeensis str. Osceola]AHX08303.1 COQ9 family protein [Ehrlichia chaffeensis str. Saint Vincent]
MDNQSSIIKATIALIPFHGVSDDTLLKACIDLNLSEEFCKFHNGIYDVLNSINENLINFINTKFHETENINNLKIREKVQHAVYLCLTYYMSLPNYRELLKSILSATSYNMCFFSKSLYKLVDHIWYLIGDQSTDFNYYTKRTTLAVVYTSTIMYFINDFSHNHSDTILFLERRINNVIQIHKLKSYIANKTEKFNIFKVKFDDE